MTFGERAALWIAIAATMFVLVWAAGGDPANPPEPTHYNGVKIDGPSLRQP